MAIMRDQRDICPVGLKNWVLWILEESINVAPTGYRLTTTLIPSSISHNLPYSSGQTRISPFLRKRWINSKKARRQQCLYDGRPMQNVIFWWIESDKVTSMYTWNAFVNLQRWFQLKIPSKIWWQIVKDDQKKYFARRFRRISTLHQDFDERH